MVKPTENKKVTIQPYVRANAGAENFVGKAIPDATAEVGAMLKKGNLHAEAGLKGGTELGVQTNAKYRMPLSKNGVMCVEFQGNVSYTH